MRCVRTSRYTQICMATRSATIVSAGFHDLRMVLMLFGSFADWTENEKLREKQLRTADGLFQRPAFPRPFQNNPRISMHSVQHTAPARPSRKVSERLDNAFQPLQKSGLRVVVAGGVHRPINQKRTPHDRTAIHESPVAAVR